MVVPLHYGGNKPIWHAVGKHRRLVTGFFVTRHRGQLILVGEHLAYPLMLNIDVSSAALLVAA
jgi:hypothetical protein